MSKLSFNKRAHNLKNYFLLILLLATPFKTDAAYLLYKHRDLLKGRYEIQKENKIFLQAYIEVIKEANEELMGGPYSVMQKTLVPPSGDPHDYISLARYYWPDPNQRDGLPYIHKDCEVNPEIFQNDYDYAKKNKMVRACLRLALAYYLTKEEKYAAHASLLIRTWFLSPDSAMNPNLNFAQIQPKISYNNPSGMIEGHTFPFVFESLNFLKGSRYWTEEDNLKMKEWAAAYLNWLLTSSKGMIIRDASNNQASWYDMQVLYFALYLKKKSLALEHMQKFTFKKLHTQFAKDYSQPHENQRKKGFFYSLFNLQALFHCALLGRHLQQDLWEINKGKNGTLRRGLDYLIAYLDKNDLGEGNQIEASDLIELSPLLLIASTVYQNTHYLDLYKRIQSLTQGFSDKNRQSFYGETLKLIYSQPFTQIRNNLYEN